MKAEEMPPRHMCHCGKSFPRKEHLRRHQSVHNQRRYRCYICNSSFTRNDLLQKHIPLHDANPFSSSIRPIACDACHYHKTKCNGELRCSACVKKNTECTRNRRTRRNLSYQGSTDQALNNSPMILAGGKEGQKSKVNATNSLQSIIKDLERPRNQRPSPYMKSEEMQIWIENRLAWFWNDFHETWQLLHAPSFPDHLHTPELIAAMAMMGSWSRDPEDAESLVFDIHDILLQSSIQDMTQMQSGYSSENPLPLETYQTALLAVIFPIESGRCCDLPKAQLLLGILINAMREDDMFNEETIECHQTLYYSDMSVQQLAEGREQWRRLTICILKADILLSMMRDQPPVVRPEELQLRLPMTLALSNAYGPDEYSDRWAKEPPDREWSTIGCLIGSYKDLSGFSLLIEDVVMGLSGTLRCIWGHTHDRRRFNLVDDDHSMLLQFLTRLDCWKVQLDRMSVLLKSSELNVQTSSFEEELFMHAYSITGKRGNIDEKRLTIARIALLLFSANMLYHVLCLNLYADIRTINIVTTGTAKFDLSMNSGRKSTKDAVKVPLLQHWAYAEDGRASILHAVSILKAYEKALLTCGDLNRRLDPVAHIAISYSSAIVHAYIMNSDSCIHNSIAEAVQPTELNLANSPGLQHWIENGGFASVDGVFLCKCDLKEWSLRFTDCLLRGGHTWQIGTNIMSRYQV
ncbi:hypothetical protein GGI35DRAFT_461735 [Trichoderma velutinum]